jgi:uncharacterized protein YndB with AHSA1/START domain
MSDTSLTIVRRIKASPATLFEALTRPEQIALWWGPDAGPVLVSETDVRVGGRFRVRFRMLDGSEHESSGVYREVAPPTRLAMTWRWAGEDKRESLVEIELRAVDDATELTFTHSRLPDAAARDSHREGWNGAFDKLERMFSSDEGDNHATAQSRIRGGLDRSQPEAARGGEGMDSRTRPPG